MVNCFDNPAGFSLTKKKWSKLVKIGFIVGIIILYLVFRDKKKRLMEAFSSSLMFNVTHHLVIYMYQAELSDRLQIG